MTVSYKKSGAGGGAYYTDCMSEDGSKSVDDYYTGSAKEPPGVWYVGLDSGNSRQSGLGIVDGQKFGAVEVSLDIDRFHSLTKGFHPENGSKLVQNAGDKNRVSFHDFTLSAPKSVSVIWSQADEVTKEKIELAQETSARTFLDFMSSKSYSRQGKGGVIKSAAPLRGAIFGHGSSREDDPQLHSHCVVMNVCERENGTTGALETMEMMRWQGAAASLYHADLAWEMRKLEFSIEKVGNLFEVAGVPEETREAFSQRRAQIVAAVKSKLEEMGLEPDAELASRGLFQAATVETRNAKNELTREELIEIWHDRGAALGFTQVQVALIMNAGEAVELTDDELLIEARAAVSEITNNHAIFKEPALLTKIAVQLVGRASPSQILKTIETIKQKDLLTTESVNKAGLAEQIFTTREMLVLERQMLKLANRHDGKHVLDKVDLPDSLDPEQLAAAVAATSDTNAVSVVEGAAGAGKTFTMAAISRAYELNGYSVTGLSGSWSAALNLQEAAKLNDAHAITGWVNSVRAGKVSINSKSMIVVDEAGMVGSRDIKNVLELAKEAGAKVILLGDTLQQKAISAGDPLRLIAQQNGSSRLDVIRRQVNESDRVSVLKFFAGQAKEGLKPYLERGDVKLGQGAAATNDLLIKDWADSQRTNPGKSHLILATDRKSVAELNALAHQALKTQGQLGEGVMVKNIECRKEADFVEMSIGDQVVFRVTNNLEGVKNKDAGQIESIDRGTNGDTLFIRTKKGLVEVDTSKDAWQHKDGGLGIQHAYACTSYSSQGLTVDATFVKDSTALARDSAGVVMSRHRDTCKVYIDKQERYEMKMRNTAADQWHPIKEFTDAECLVKLEKSWSSEREKSSTLDFDQWRQTAAVVDQAIEVKIQESLEKTDAAKELAKREIEKIYNGRKDKKLAFEGVQALQPLFYHTGPHFELDELKPNREAAQRGVNILREQIGATGVDEATHEAMKQAGEAKFLSFNEKGDPVFCGRRPDDQKLVMTHIDLAEQKSSLRDRYPPILQGDPSRLDIVRTGKQAIELRSIQIREQLPQSTIVISQGKNDALSYPHVREIAEKAESVQRHDTPKAEEKMSELNINTAQEQARQAIEQAQKDRELHR